MADDDAAEAAAMRRLYETYRPPPVAPPVAPEDRYTAFLRALRARAAERGCLARAQLEQIIELGVADIDRPRRGAPYDGDAA